MTPKITVHSMGLSYQNKWERKAPSPSAIQVKKRTTKEISIKMKLHVVADLKNVNEMLTYAVILDLVISALSAVRENADRITESAK